MQLSDGTAQQLVDQLDRAQDATSEALILRKIKNNVTGHELRKVAYIRAGLLPALCDVLSAQSTTSSDESSSHVLLEPEEAIWWHASSIVMVLANAGTAFTSALLDGNLVAILLDQLRVTNPTERVALNIIRCLHTIAHNLPLAVGKDWIPDQRLAKELYKPENAACLTKFAAILPKTWHAQQRMEAILVLICSTCRSDKQIALLVDNGLLDVLCRHLANYILLHQSKQHDYTANAQDRPGTQNTYLPLVLESIAMVIDNSGDRAQDFALHEAIEGALGVMMGTIGAVHEHSTHGSISRSTSTAQHHISHDFSLPIIPDLHAMYLAKTSTWPPLPHLTNDTAAISRRQTSIKISGDNSPMHGESWDRRAKYQAQGSALVPWLLYITRSAGRNDRVMAAKVLAILKSHHMLDGRTIRSLAALLVPIIVDLLDSQPDFGQPEFLYAEQVPAVLALLVKDHEFLQQAAVDAKAIPRLAAGLKANFEGAQNVPKDLWWPTRLQEKLTVGVRDRSLGPGGPSSQMRMQMVMREGLLRALAALAPDSDVFRKDICDQGALNHIILALEPLHTRIIPGHYCDRMTIMGNSSEALIAACGAVRALTRSPTSLRTKIVDADVAKHIIKLLYTPEPTVRIAATMVVANLSHGFSPMKSSIAEAPVIKKLCEQAHSANAQLRRETLFALKAFINLSTNKVKKMVVEELGINWIRHLLATDPHDVPAGEIIGLVEKDYRKGSRIRTSTDTAMQDVGYSESEREVEGFNHHTLQQDLEIQAELLGFLRNLTTGENPLEIIDFVLDEIGNDEFFQIMVDRLKSSTMTESCLAGKIIQNCIYVIAHLAIADSKYRSPIAHNLILMKQINTFLGHSDPLIRRACCWLIIGVVYSTTESHQAAVLRARDLQRLGIVANLRRIEKNDLDTDVKERASTACDVFKKLLDKA